MENIVLTVGGFLKNLGLSDLFFFTAVLILILLLIYIIFLMKTEGSIEEKKTSEKKELKKDEEDMNKTKNLIDIVNTLETNYEPKPVDLSKYEQEMEDTAIISYDELLKRSTNSIAYESDYQNSDSEIMVKKVDSTNSSNNYEKVDSPKPIMMSYESEESFLKALKILQSNLVR